MEEEIVQDDVVRLGDSVVLYFGMTTLCLIPRIDPSGVTHNSSGFFSHEDIIGKPLGSKIHPKHKTETPRPAYILHVTPELFTLAIPHKTQIIYHADISMIMMGLNILPGAIVAEAGTGSASLSFSLAYTIGPRGRLYTFEIDTDRAIHNRELLQSMFRDDRVVLEERDVITAGFPAEIENSVDSLFLDLPSPWLAITNAKSALKENGRICTFSPSIEQVTKNVTALTQNGFHQIKTVEVMLKPWGMDRVREDGVAGKKRKIDEGISEEKKPATRSSRSFQLPMRGHTSYLTFAIKGLEDEHLFPKPVLSVGEVRKLIKANNAK